jgi:hypothetical protein
MIDVVLDETDDVLGSTEDTAFVSRSDVES